MMQRIRDQFSKQTGREYRPNQRLLALAVEAIFFLGLLPWALIRLGWAIDQWVGLPAMIFPPFNAILGVPVMLGAWLFAVWSIYAQFTIGRGTPVPLMATQKLIIQPPYAYCRNPMALGAIGMYLGVAVLFGSIGAFLLVILGAVALLTYIKTIEEKEMEVRFGQEYLNYKRCTPFLLPRFCK